MSEKRLSFVCLCPSDKKVGKTTKRGTQRTKEIKLTFNKSPWEREKYWHADLMGRDDPNTSRIKFPLKKWLDFNLDASENIYLRHWLECKFWKKKSNENLDVMIERVTTARRKCRLALWGSTQKKKYDARYVWLNVWFHHTTKEAAGIWRNI